MPTIRVDSIDITIDDLEAKSTVPEMAKVANQMIEVWLLNWTPGYHPYPDLAAAEFLADKLGGKVTDEGKPPKIPEGAVA